MFFAHEILIYESQRSNLNRWYSPLIVVKGFDVGIMQYCALNLNFLVWAIQRHIFLAQNIRTHPYTSKYVTFVTTHTCTEQKVTILYSMLLI